MRGAIAAGHPATAAVGAEVLRAGGSAVDACVAAAFASWVAEPALTGPGGGGFLVAYDARRRRPLALDFFTAVPGSDHSGAVAPLEPYIVDFGTGRQTFLVGPGSCAVPGVTAGLEAAHRRRPHHVASRLDHHQEHAVFAIVGRLPLGDVAVDPLAVQRLAEKGQVGEELARDRAVISARRPPDPVAGRLSGACAHARPAPAPRGIPSRPAAGPPSARARRADR